MIDAELQGRVHRTHVKALQSVFSSPVFSSRSPRSGDAPLNPPTETLWRRSTFVSRRFHPRPPQASLRPESTRANYSRTRLLRFVEEGIVPELHTWVNITHAKEHYVTGNLWGSEKTIMSLPRSEVSSSPHTFSDTPELKPGSRS